MIKNERQYRITKAQAEKFIVSLSQLTALPSGETHPLLRKAQEDALNSQIEELTSQLSEYESLQSGQQIVLETASFSELPRALIRSRIAAGLSQKQLAGRLGLKEQQIQQYEATEYSAASLTRVREVIQALGILVREDVFLPGADISKTRLFQRLQSIGISRDLVLKRILPKPLAARLEAEPTAGRDAFSSTVLEAASVVEHVFDLKPATIFGSSPLRLNMSALGTAHFKVPTQVDERKMSAYTVYAHYLALLALQATPHLEKKVVPTDPHMVHEAIVSGYGAMTFENALRYIWSLGVVVLPLTDAGSFHGACWRVDGRNVVVLKQQTRYPARWLNDGLHELCHAGQEPSQEEKTVIETEDILRGQQDSEEEEQARYFAEDVIFDGRAEDVAQLCARKAGKRMERMSAFVPQVAASEGVPADALAYYIAYSVSLDGGDWWGAATNLQDKNTDAWKIARDVFVEQADLSAVNETDRRLLLQALNAGEE